MKYTIDYFYHLNHRRLRDKFKMETIERHESKVQSALEKRHNKERRNEE